MIGIGGVYIYGETPHISISINKVREQQLLMLPCYYSYDYSLLHTLLDGCVCRASNHSQSLRAHIRRHLSAI